MVGDPLLEEYKVCERQCRHIDEQNWMWGSFLFGGSIAGAGFVLSQNLSAFRLLSLALLSTAVLVGYVLFVKRAVAQKRVYIMRMCEIEASPRFFNTLVTASRIGYQTRAGKIGEKFDVLLGMVAFYLIILYVGTAVLIIKTGFIIP